MVLRQIKMSSIPSHKTKKQRKLALQQDKEHREIQMQQTMDQQYAEFKTQCAAKAQSQVIRQHQEVFEMRRIAHEVTEEKEILRSSRRSRPVIGGRRHPLDRDDRTYQQRVEEVGDWMNERGPDLG